MRPASAPQSETAGQDPTPCLQTTGGALQHMLEHFDDLSAEWDPYSSLMDRAVDALQPVVHGADYFPWSVGTMATIFNKMGELYLTDIDK
jgi:hypothetical protein